MPSPRLVFAMVVAVAAPLGGCAVHHEPQPSGSSAAGQPDVVYRCGTEYAVARVDTERLALHIDGGRYLLRQVAAASGARYRSAEDGATEFWSKGERARLRVRGESRPDCIRVDDPAAWPLRAVGNEPPWTLTMTADETELKTGYEGRAVTGETRTVATGRGDTDYLLDAGRRDIRIAVRRRICRDSMTGMPHPLQVAVQFDGRPLPGCGGDPDMLLQGVEWVAETIDGAAVVDGARPTLVFLEHGRFAGFGSCSRYNGTYRLTGEVLELSPVAATRQACRPVLMRQEADLFELLDAAHRFDVSDDGALVLHGSGGRALFTPADD